MKTLGGKIRFAAFVLLLVLPFFYPSFCRGQTIPSGPWGSINYWGVSGASQVLQPGTAGYCLETQGVGSAPLWIACPGSALNLLPGINTNQFYGNVSGQFAPPVGVDVNTILNTVGYDISRPPAVESILYKSNVGPSFNWQTLPPGANGSILTSGGPTNPPFWSPSPTQSNLASICQTVGALLYFDTPSLLWKCINPGTSGQVLQTGGAGANPSWLTIAATSPLVYNAGSFSCPTCATTTNGGALSATAPILLSAAGVISMPNPLPVANGGTGQSSSTGAGAVVLATSPTLTGSVAITSTSASALAVGANGATNPAFNVDSSASSQVAGLNVKGAATGGMVALSAIDSGANTNLSIDAKGTGTVTVGSNSTGSILLLRAVGLGSSGSSNGLLSFAGATSGSIQVTVPSGALGNPTLTLPAATDTLVARATSDTLTNKTFDTAGAGNNFKIGGEQVTATTTRAGDIIYNNGTNWVALPGNNSGTGTLQESPAGVPVWASLASGAAGQLPGTATNDNATSGNVGEFIKANVASGAAVALTSGVGANITSVSLTAGDWDVQATCVTNPSSTTQTAVDCGVNTTSATQPDPSVDGGRNLLQGISTASPIISATNSRRFSLAGTTTVFMVMTATFSGGTEGGYGTIRARRMR